VRTIGVRPEGWLFVGPPLKQTVNRWWHNTLKAGGVSDVRLQDLRHFYASGLIANGCDVVTVQRVLGHANATTTVAADPHL
jgi:integrase